MVEDHIQADIAQLVADHHQGVYAYAYRLSGSVQDAEDLTQQTFLTAQRKLGQLRNVESAKSWLFTILRNHFLGTCRKKRPTPAASLQLDVDTIPQRLPDPVSIDSELLQRAIEELPPKYRVVLTMFYYEDCSYREIADQLELPIGTVMSRLARAKGRLRSRIFEPGLGSDVGRRQDAAAR